MKRKTRVLAVFLILVLSVAILSGCKGADSAKDQKAGQDVSEKGRDDGEKVYGGTFIVGIPSDPTCITAALTTDSHDKFAWQPMAIGLLDYDASNNMEPVCTELAESYEFSDDYKHLTFHLREAYWTDGEQITSEDVKFTIEKFLVPYSSNMSSELANLETIECPDDLTVTLNLSEPNSALIGFWHSFYCSVLPEHVWADYTENYQECPEYQNPTVTGGPFVLDEYVSGDHLTYKKNEKYWNEEEPYIDTLILKIIPDQTTMGEALEAGEIDLAISYDECDRLRDVEGITVYDMGKELRTTVYYISMNVQSEKLADKEMRIALLEAVDQDAIIEKCFNNYGKPSYSPIPDNAAFNEIRVEPLHQYKYDSEAAKERLDKAGYTAGSDGSRGILLTVIVENNDKERMIAELLRGYWDEIGVELEIISLDRAALCERVYTERDYDICMIDGGLSSDFAATANRYVSSYTGNYTNPANMRNDRVDEIFKTVGAQDAETQKTLYAELQNEIADEACTIWLQNWAPYAVGSNIGGFPLRPDVQFDNYAGVWIKDN